MQPRCEVLVSLDLDGTAVRYDPRLEMDPALVEYLIMMRQQGVAWVMNSDRYTDTMIDIACLLEPENRPAALLSCQRFIHFLDGRDMYLPFNQWNRQRIMLHKRLWGKIAPFFDEWQRSIDSEFTVIERVINDLVFAYMVPADQTPALRVRMRELVRPWPEAQLSGNHDWTFVLHAAFSKGSVLLRCAEKLGIERHNIIAVGDGLNDISMLDGSITPMVGCPANASSEVLDAVRKAGGIVAEKEAASGTLDVLRHYLGHAPNDFRNRAVHMGRHDVFSGPL